MMNDLYKALPHMIMATVVVVAMCVLAIDHIVTGGEAVGLISAAGGFTLGGAVASGSATVAMQTAAATSPSRSAGTASLTQTTPSKGGDPDAGSTATATFSQTGVRPDDAGSA